MHALVLQRLTPRVDTHIHKSSVRRHTTSSHVTRATSKAEALAELQALRQGVSQHLAATETALQAAAGTIVMHLCSAIVLNIHVITVSTPTTEALVEVTRPENDLHEISAAQFDELISTAGDAVVMVKFTSSKCVGIVCRCCEAVMDTHTYRCGPCKLMLPKLVSMRDEYPNAHFVKVCVCDLVDTG